MGDQVKIMQTQMEELKRDFNNNFELLLAKLNEKTSSFIVNSLRNLGEEQHSNGGSRSLSFMPSIYHITITRTLINRQTFRPLL